MIIRKILMARKSIWVAVSSHLQIWPNSQTPTAVLMNPILSTLGQAPRITATKFLSRLVYIGRLDNPQKRPERMLPIGAACDLDVEMIGQGLMEESLQSEVIAKGLKVDFAGFVHDPWSHVRAGDLLIVPSAWEGDGLVVLECMQRDIPILLSDIPDFRRFGLPEKNYCRDVGDFVERINNFRDDLTSLIVPEFIKNPILASRSPDYIGNTWENFLNSI